MVVTSKYWDLERTLTYGNVLFYVIVGNRTAGKTYACKKRGINNFIKKKEQFEADYFERENTITLTGTGESLETEQPISSVKVVTKQYVDGKFTEVPTYTAITNSEIDLLFV